MCIHKPQQGQATPPAFRACPGDAECARKDRCQALCSQPQDAEYVNGEALRTGKSPTVVLRELNELRGTA